MNKEHFGRMAVVAGICSVLGACSAAPGSQQSFWDPAPAPAAQPATPPLDEAPGPGWVVGGRGEASVEWMHLSTKTRSGNLVRAWIIQNHPIDAVGSRSTRNLQSFDCGRRQERILSMSGHSGWNAQGRVLFQSNVADQTWRPVPPGTIGEATFRIACQR